MKQDQYPKLPTGVPHKPFDKIAIDLVGPLMKSYVGNVYILTMIDLFSGWPEAMGISDKKSGNCGSHLPEGIPVPTLLPSGDTLRSR